MDTIRPKIDISELQSRLQWKQELNWKMFHIDEGGIGIRVGCEHIDYLWKWEAIKLMLDLLEKGVTIQDAAAQAKSEARETVARHNSRRKKDQAWRRWDGCIDSEIEFVEREYKTLLSQI